MKPRILWSVDYCNVIANYLTIHDHQLVNREVLVDLVASGNEGSMTKETLTQLREVHAVQGRDGCWDIDDYMLGLYNGLELALSIVESRECRYKQRPKSQRTWVGLTDEEITELHHEIKVRLMGTYKTEDIYRAIEAKLRSKNNG
jgi:hypothetical protein